MFKVNNKDMRMTSMTHSGVFIAKFEQNLHMVQFFPLLILDK